MSGMKHKHTSEEASTPPLTDPAAHRLPPVHPTVFDDVGFEDDGYLTDLIGKRGSIALTEPPNKKKKLEGDEEFELDPDQVEDERREEALDGKAHSKTPRPTKLTTARAAIDQRSGKKKSAVAKTEQEVADERKARFPHRPLKFPKKMDQHAAFTASCGRCPNPIYMNAAGQELGVGFGKHQRRQAPPDGHILDWITYANPLERAVEDEVLSEEEDEAAELATREHMRRHAAWDPENIHLEHFDCNATATKITKGSITEAEERKGQKHVTSNLSRWKELSRRSVDAAKKGSRAPKPIPGASSGSDTE